MFKIPELSFKQNLTNCYKFGLLFIRIQFKQKWLEWCKFPPHSWCQKWHRRSPRGPQTRRVDWLIIPAGSGYGEATVGLEWDSRRSHSWFHMVRIHINHKLLSHIHVSPAILPLFSWWAVYVNNISSLSRPQTGSPTEIPINTVLHTSG